MIWGQRVDVYPQLGWHGPQCDTIIAKGVRFLSGRQQFNIDHANKHFYFKFFFVLCKGYIL